MVPKRTAALVESVTKTMTVKAPLVPVLAARAAQEARLALEQRRAEVYVSPKDSFSAFPIDHLLEPG